MSGPYQFLPPLSDAEYDALRADIAANGMRHPIIVDEKGKILDGHHRARIAGELGFKPERETVAGLTEEEKRDLAFTLNSARRHLDAAGRRAAVVASLKADPQLSDRQHARRTGVSHPTVASIRAELVTAGRLESFTSRVSADGRTRPATQPSSPTGSETAPIADLPQEPNRSGSTAAEDDIPSADADGEEPIQDGPVRAAAASPESTEGEGSGEVTPDLDPDESHREWLRQFAERATAVREGRESFASFAADFTPGMAVCAGPYEHGLMAALQASQTPDPEERRAPNRKPIPDAFQLAAWDLVKVAERLERLVQDDRFPRNAEQVGRLSRHDLLRAGDLLATVVDRIPNPTKESTE